MESLPLAVSSQDASMKLMSSVVKVAETTASHCDMQTAVTKQLVASSGARGPLARRKMNSVGETADKKSKHSAQKINLVTTVINTDDNTTDDGKHQINKPASPVRIVVSKDIGDDKVKLPRAPVHSRLGARPAPSATTDTATMDKLLSRLGGDTSGDSLSTGHRAKDMTAQQVTDLRHRIRGNNDAEDVNAGVPDVAAGSPPQRQTDKSGTTSGRWNRRRRPKNDITSSGGRTFGRSRYS
jgi:hypothetical protein